MAGEEPIIRVRGLANRFGQQHPTFHKLIATGAPSQGFGPVRLPDAVIGIAPNAKLHQPCPRLGSEQVPDAGAVVGEGINPRPAVGDHPLRYPEFGRAGHKELTQRAPVPVEVINHPSVCGPPCSTLVANTGMSTAYGMPAKLTQASSKSRSRIGVNAATYANPSRISRKKCVSRTGRSRATIRMANSAPSTAT